MALYGGKNITSDWVSGNLVFFESSAAQSVTTDLLTLGTTAVKIGGTGNDVDFQYYGTGSLSAIIDCGAATFTLTGISINAGSTQHLTINTTSSDKTVRINSQSYTVAASIIGMQTKPRAGVNMTSDIIGIESMPGINSTFTSTAGIVCFKAEPYIHSTAGAITGDVRGYEVSLGCPTGAGTITGVLSGMKCINNTTKAVTGGIYPMYVVAHGDAQPWNGVMLIPDEGVNSIGDLASGTATINSVFKVVVGSTVSYIAGYATYTPA